MVIRVAPELHVEVHKYHFVTVAGVTLVALVLQAFLPNYFPRARDVMELPLLVTIYFGLSRRNPAAGLLLGGVIGILQDSLSSGRSPIGLYGIAKTLVGFVASSIGLRLNVDHPASRFMMTFLFSHFHQAVLVVIKRLLLGRPEPLLSLPLVVASLVNGALAVVLFPLLDRLRKTS